MRNTYDDWDTCFLKVARVASGRSKDPRSPIGCCIVEPTKKRIVGFGYNGFPRNFQDQCNRWERTNKANYVIHAELNAILNASEDLAGCYLYMYSGKGYYPCNECAKVIAQKGIKKVIIDVPLIECSDHSKQYNFDITEEIFKECGIEVVRFALMD